MPNHVCTQIKMKSITKKDLFNADGEFDFNKLIPMPETLNMESGTYESIAIEAVATKAAEAKNEFGFGFSIRHTDNFTSRMASYVEKDGESKVYEDGLAYITNLIKYGATTWYDWCRINWGTKWNAYNYCEIDEDTIQFQTAWSMPEPIIEALSKAYPDEEVEVMWADEDTGANTGKSTYKNGKLINGGYFEDCSNEAYEAYIELHGESNCLAKDEDGNWYHKNCENCDGCD